MRNERKAAEMDVQLMANRLARLKSEEQQALRKVGTCCLWIIVFTHLPSCAVNASTSM